ncbi:hypothetical protein SHKM778_27240 [Streptomyces sp. KM77-8]|uniref:Uncharacterized protein n=1 Tax=Streptomyces haneummycinicus TaxID=3074435 RepID=A0AAT9HGB0_9ACTN
MHTTQLPIEVTVRPSVRQVSLAEKTPRPHRIGGLPEKDRPHRWCFPTYRWEQGRRDYLLTLVADSDADPLETELQFAMVSIGDVHAPVTARWHHPGQSPHQELAGADSVRTLNATARMRSALRRGSSPFRRTGGRSRWSNWGRPPRWRCGSTRNGCWTRSARSPISRTRPRDGSGCAASTPAPSAR